MSQSMQIKANTSGSDLILDCHGQMDEDVVYPTLDVKAYQSLTLDLGSVTLINSTGLQKWVKFLEGLPTTLTWKAQNCAIRVVHQINLFPSFFASRSVTVTSFFAPYFCVTCDQTQSILLETSTHLDSMRHGHAPAKTCHKCKNPVEFDGLESKYFKFLSRFS